MTAWLRREGHPINPKRIRRLLRLMGIEAIYPHAKHNLSKPDKEHKIFPYLLRGVTVDRVNQVLVNGYNLHSNASWLGLFDSCYRLV